MLKRKFIPGDTWLFYKLYCGAASSDKILEGVIYPVYHKALANRIIRKAFFIRYGDPEYHLRIRFSLNYDRIGEFMSLFNSHLEKWVNNGLIWKVAIDSYERELERYDPLLMENTECLFSVDSAITFEILRFTRAAKDDSLRWKFCIYIINKYLDFFSLTLVQKEKLLSFLQKGFTEEHGIVKAEKLRMDAKYRFLNKELIHSLDINSQLKVISESLIDELRKNCENIKSICDQHRISESFFVSQYLPSVLHMHCNRIFKSRQRTNEMVIYYFMWKVYKTQMALIPVE